LVTGTLTVWKLGSSDGANQAIGTPEGLARWAGCSGAVVRDDLLGPVTALFQETGKVRDTFRARGLRAQLIVSNLSDEQEATIHELFAD
jgi:hypothetical protein